VLESESSIIQNLHVGVVADVIKCVKAFGNRYRFSVLYRPPKMAFSSDDVHRPYRLNVSIFISFHAVVYETQCPTLDVPA